MSRVAAVCLALAACTTPDYAFAPADSGTPTTSNRDARPLGDDDDDGGPIDAGADVLVEAAAPLPATAMPNTGDFAADCTGFTSVGDMSSKLVTNGAVPHCLLFFHNATWKRTWPEAKAMCPMVTRGGTAAHLAVAPTQADADDIQSVNSMIATWVGLTLAPGGDPTDKAQWTWITGAPSAYDGWTTGEPTGAGCVFWGGASRWSEAECTLQKGVLCEVEGP